MKNKMSYYILLFIAFLLLSACNTPNDDMKNNIGPIMYDFKEPVVFPFDVNDISTEIDIQNPDYLHQFIFHYYNEETTQKIKYIVSKVLDEPKDNEVSKENKTEYKLANGKSAYYEENTTSQSIWWENENGFLARFVYYTNGNTSELGEFKLDVKELVELANQVQ
ncbi:hypothetical protein GH741_12730 [Aquibacillus halophilus]|uniref:DUF4367 domain-containing protein n=1 Tax=Aquibacillus halophilus TaxID=930132 RepID=A0A6A8DCX8_9BACI|nr:hypothetical protein [Aquibacillus halophilus]MRH43545.1 hypothetical protein [Aquibacillus halophilus]